MDQTNCWKCKSCDVWMAPNIVRCTNCATWRAGHPPDTLTKREVFALAAMQGIVAGTVQAFGLSNGDVSELVWKLEKLTNDSYMIANAMMGLTMKKDSD